MSSFDVISLAHEVCAGRSIDREEALALARLMGSERVDLFAGANRIRHHFHGDRIDLCAIVNAKSGACSGDCAFCAQSAHHSTDVAIYPLISTEEYRGYAEGAAQNQVRRFGIVTSGEVLSDAEFARVIEFISAQKKACPTLGRCVSIGAITRERAEVLKAAGCERIHHNLETSRRHFSKVCSTHSYDDRIETIKNAQSAGLGICSGCLFGMGESWDDRIDLFLELRSLGVDSVPINFLNPIPGTPAFERGWGRFMPLECLTIIAVGRYLLPKAQIRVCGGKEVHLRQLHSWMFMAGADATMTGNYLTTPGRCPEEDFELLKDLELDWSPRD